VLTFALGSTASTLIQTQAKAEIPSVSYGYDRLRFVKPVYFGDTVTATYTIIEIDNDNLKSVGKVEVVNQHGEVVVVANHILKFFPLD
jgi:acyl dehydratase